MRKVKSFVRYPTELDLSSFVKDSRYELYSVLIHEGYSLNSGHYYSYVKTHENKWFCMNDSFVSSTNETNVLKQLPYILFYKKKSPIVEIIERPISINPKIPNTINSTNKTENIKESTLTPRQKHSLTELEKIIPTNEKMENGVGFHLGYIGTPTRYIPINLLDPCTAKEKKEKIDKKQQQKDRLLEGNTKIDFYLKKEKEREGVNGGENQNGMKEVKEVNVINNEKEANDDRKSIKENNQINYLENIKNKIKEKIKSNTDCNFPVNINEKQQKTAKMFIEIDNDNILFEKNNTVRRSLTKKLSQPF